MTKTNKYAIFGNPMKYTLSPTIYQLFAKNFKIKINYIKIQTSKKEVLKSIKGFFSKGGCGVNVTSPFKKIAMNICDTLTKKAKLIQSINLITKVNNLLIGDNTDGLGLIMDLKRINFLKDNILIIGSGGAAQGILLYLLKLKKKSQL